MFIHIILIFLCFYNTVIYHFSFPNIKSSSIRIIKIILNEGDKRIKNTKVFQYLTFLNLVDFFADSREAGISLLLCHLSFYLLISLSILMFFIQHIFIPFLIINLFILKIIYIV